MTIRKLQPHTLLVLGVGALIATFCMTTSIVSAQPTPPTVEHIAQASLSTRGQRANTFELQGDRVHINYSATSINGVPTLSYRDSQRQLKFSGSDIRITETEIGQLLTVTIEQIPDLRKVTLTLVLPIVNLPPNTSQRPVQTIAIQTVQRTNIGGPDLVDGQVQSYRTLNLKGTARLLRS